MPLVSLIMQTSAVGDEPLHNLDLSEVPQVGEDIAITNLEGDETTYEVSGRRFAVDLRENILAKNIRVLLYVRAPDAMTLAAQSLIGIPPASPGDKTPGPRGPVPREPGDTPPPEIPTPPPMPNPLPGGM